MHRPIYEVMDFPTSELDLWALVFYEEQQELDGKKTNKKTTPNKSVDEQIERFKSVMKKNKKR